MDMNSQEYPMDSENYELDSQLLLRSFQDFHGEAWTSMHIFEQPAIC